MQTTTWTCAIIGAKGGTGKTSSTVNFAHLLTSYDRRVVIVDADPQGSLTRRCGIDRVPDPLSAVPVIIPMHRKAAPGPASEVLLMPGGRRLEHADESQLAAHFTRAKSLGDLVLIDTPPAVGPIVLAAIRAADLVVVPTVPGAESLDGFADMNALAHDDNPTKCVRAVLTLANQVSRVFKWSTRAFDQLYPGVLYESVIPFEMAAAESGTVRMPVTVSAPASRAESAYRRLAHEVFQDLRTGTVQLSATEVAHAR